MGGRGSYLAPLVIPWASSPNAKHAVKLGLVEAPEHETGPGPSPLSYWVGASNPYPSAPGGDLPASPPLLALPWFSASSP